MNILISPLQGYSTGIFPELLHTARQKMLTYFGYLIQQEAQLMLAYPRDAKTMRKIPPFRSYNKFQSSRKSDVYSN